MKLMEAYSRILTENPLGLPEPTTTKPAARQDMEDALDHMSDIASDDYGNRLNLSLNNFSIENKMMTIDEIGDYDDLSSWPEWKENDLVDMDDEERMAEISSFRGPEWARRAAQWMRTGQWPTIVIVELQSGYTAVGDGKFARNNIEGKIK